MSEKSATLKFHILQALFWCANCTLTTYAAAWFLASGMSSTRVSLILAASMFISFLGQLFWGKICDREFLNKEVFILCLILAVSLTYVLCRFLLNGQWIGILFYPVLMFFISSLATNLDAWENRYLKNQGKSLGISRGCAAAAYSTFHFFYAKQVAQTDYQIIPKAAIVLYAAVILFAIAMPSVRIQEKKEEHVGQLEKKSKVSDLLENKTYLSLLLIIFLIGIGTSPISSMKVLLYQDVGKDVSFLGVDSLFCSGIQIPFFFLGGVMSNIDPKKRLFAGSIILAAASGLLMTADNAFLVLLGNAAISSAYPFILLSVRTIVTKELDPKLQTRANGICDAIYSSISGIIAMLYTGRIVDVLGIRVLIMISFLVYLVSVLLIFAKTRRIGERRA